MKVKIKNIGKDIFLSINERERLQVIFYNAKKELKYCKMKSNNDVIRACQERSKEEIEKYREEYFRLRQMLANYQDEKTLKADKFFKGLTD